MSKLLRDLDFRANGSHVALVSKTLNGGPANKWDVLITKGMADAAPEVVEKAAKIKVTMEVCDFLESMFGLYSADADMIAAIFGYIEDEESEEMYGVYDPENSFWSWFQDQQPEGVDVWELTPTAADRKAFMESQLAGIEIVKSLKDSEDINKSLSELSADDLVSVLKAQAALEPVIAHLEKSQGENMKIETLTKAQHEDLLKAAIDAAVADIQITLTKSQEDLAQAQEDLVKALAEVSAMQEEKAAAKAAARLETLVKAVGEAEAEPLMKSLETLADDAFEVVVKSFELKAAAIQESDLTKELGVAAEGTTDEDRTRAILLTKFAK